MEIKDVENLAELGRIEFSEEEKSDMLKDMEDILGYVKQIEAVEVSKTPSEYSAKNVWREDKPDNREFSSELILKQFPDSKDGFLKVKKIL
jgi:aspartyl-tRNA(Asn)/glutamyl-tRNA(Gln) amidotransferase subunit C